MWLATKCVNELNLITMHLLINIYDSNAVFFYKL